MRPEHIKELAQIEEQLVEVFQGECKPDEWPGMGTVQDRADRYWHKKNALATLNLVARIQTVVRDAKHVGKPAEPEDEIEREARRLAKQGQAVVRRYASKGH